MQRLWFLALALVACAAPHSVAYPSDQPVRALRASVCGWDSYNRALVRESFALAARVGVRVVEDVDCAAPGIVHVRHADMTDATTGACVFSGLTFPGVAPAAAVVWVDPVCSPGESVRRATFVHELLHAAGAEHVCARPGELPDARHPHERCSPVGYGRAVLNPYLELCDAAPGFDAVTTSCAGRDEPTELDRAEVARANGVRL